MSRSGFLTTLDLHAGFTSMVCTCRFIWYSNTRLNETTRAGIITLFLLKGGMNELAVSTFIGFWVTCARGGSRRPDPRLSILMQTRSLGAQRGYISRTKDVLSQDTTHTVFNGLIQSCFVWAAFHSWSFCVSPSVSRSLSPASSATGPTMRNSLTQLACGKTQQLIDYSFIMWGLLYVWRGIFSH